MKSIIQQIVLVLALVTMPGCGEPVKYEIETGNTEKLIGQCMATYGIMLKVYNVPQATEKMEQIADIAVELDMTSEEFEALVREEIGRLLPVAVENPRKARKLMESLANDCDQALIIMNRAVQRRTAVRNSGLGPP